jgi:hypothetical protein
VSAREHAASTKCCLAGEGCNVKIECPRTDIFAARHNFAALNRAHKVLRPYHYDIELGMVDIAFWLEG